MIEISEFSKVGSPLPEVRAIDDGSDDSRPSFWTQLWYGVAVCAIAVNIAAMVLEGPVVAVVAGVVAVAIAPFVIFYQTKLENTNSLRSVQNRLRKEVNRLSGENVKLVSEIKELEKQVCRLKDQEAKLDKISNEQDVHVDNLISLVKENQTTIDGLKEAVKADLCQILLTSVIESDFDSSGQFSDSEIEILALRLSNVPGVKVNAELLKTTAMQSDRSLVTILGYLDQLKQNDIPEDQRIFQLDESNLPQY